MCLSNWRGEEVCIGARVCQSSCYTCIIWSTARVTATIAGIIIMMFFEMWDKCNRFFYFEISKCIVLLQLLLLLVLMSKVFEGFTDCLFSYFIYSTLLYPTPSHLKVMSSMPNSHLSHGIDYYRPLSAWKPWKRLDFYFNYFCETLSLKGMKSGGLYPHVVWLVETEAFDPNV